MTQIDDYPRGRKDGIQWAITWLHKRAKEMNDPKATAILNTAAFQMGQESHPKESNLMSEQFQQYRRKEKEGS